MEDSSVLSSIVMLFVIVAVVVIVLCWALPIYRVWQAHKSGQADLARANNEQLIRVSQAKGRLQAAELNKQAAIIEAEAVAEQISRIGQGLTTHDLYLKWQWIKMMEDRDGSTIYVPTEASLPILEAARLKLAET